MNCSDARLADVLGTSCQIARWLTRLAPLFGVVISLALWPELPRLLFWAAATVGRGYTSAMRRTLTLLALLTAMFWQAIGMAGQGPVIAYAEEPAHAMLHWQEKSHHHHDEGAFHVDDSNESLQHIVADGVLSTVATWSVGEWLPESFRHAAPRPSAEAAPPTPYLHGLRRPPRLDA